VNDTFEVTLPNKEVVKFNATTKEIVGGVLSEGPMAQEKNGKAKIVEVKYSGAGVLIRIDKVGELTTGDIDVRGKAVPSPNIAVISKKGQKDCKVPAKDMWYTDYEKQGKVMMKKEYSTDKGINDFILKKCGFSIY
jgi:hypothetical protein